MSEAQIIHAYVAAATPILRSCMKPNTCVAATRVTVECLKRFGIEVVPCPVKWVVQFPKLKIAFTAGLTEEERSTARERIACSWNDTVDPWNGHLIAMGCGYLIDASFEQAMIATGRPTERKRLAVFPFAATADPHRLIEYTAITDDGHDVTITYITTEDRSWESSAAWTDTDLQYVCRAIVSDMRTELRAIYKR